MRFRRSAAVVPALLVVVFLLAAFGVAPAWAQPLADRLPADAVVYVGWRGSDALGPAYDKSHLKAVLDASKLQAYVRDLVPKLIDRAAEEDQGKAMAIEALLPVAELYRRHPSAVFFSGLVFEPGREPTPRMGLVCDAGDDALTLVDTLENLITAAGPEPEVPVQAFRQGNVVFLTFGYANAETEIGDAPAGGTLAAAPRFADAVKYVRAADGVTLVTYFDTERLLTLIDQSVEHDDDEETKVNWPKVRDALGLPGIKAYARAEGFDGTDWSTRTFVAAPGERTGLVKLLGEQPVDDDVLAAVPKTTAFAMVRQLDPLKVLNEIRNAVAAVDPKGAQTFDQGLGAISLFVGRNLQRDILGPLGDQWVLYSDAGVGGAGPTGLVVVNKLDDPSKGQASVSAVTLAISNTLRRAAADKGMPFTSKTLERPGVKVYYLDIQLPPAAIEQLGGAKVNPAWAYKEGRLYVGLAPEAVAAAVDATAAAGEGGTILQNEQFRALRERLGAKRVTGFQYADLPQSAPAMYDQLKQALDEVLAAAAEDEGARPFLPPADLLPSKDVLLKHLAPAAQMSWVDEAGWHASAVSPFPGADLLSSQQSVSAAGAGALGASILLPSLNRARETANRVKSASNLRQIGLANQLYANENGGKYAPDLGTLLATQDLAPEVFVSPRTDTSLPPKDGTVDLKAWTNADADYAWLGAGMTTDTPGGTVVAHEKPDRVEDGINILFADGSVQFFKTKDALNVIENGARPDPPGAGDAPAAPNDAGL